MLEVYVGLGANLGDRAANLEEAVAALAELGPVRRSSWYETEPVGMAGALRFLNGVVRLRTELEPEALLERALGIETRLGRDQTARKGSRAIDIDILLYEDLIVKTATLVVPHPRMHERAFVLVPLAELAPDLVHPVLGLTVRTLLSRVSQAGVRLWSGA